MSTMEYRAWITVPGLAFEDEERWEPFITSLERERADLGAIIGWDGDDAYVVVTTDAPDRATAALELLAAVGDALRRACLEDAEPRVARIEVVPEDELRAAA